MARIKRDDQVMILGGKNRGKKGKVLHVIPASGRVVVEGLNLIKKHVRRSQENPQGAIISRESPLPLDRVQPICPRCNRGVRVGFKVLGDGSKTRICRRCEESF
jgi:large subunit ribosomal protein L24